MLPEFIIIGTMKGGTTSLHYYLSQHPEIFMSKQKELNFFIKERNWRRGLSRAVARPQIDELLRRALVERLEEDTVRLRALTGLALEGWSV